MPSASLLPLALLPTLFGCSGPSPGPAPAALHSGVPVQMTLPRVGGGALSLSSLRGRPVLITLFTTWCIPCQVEAPGFVRLDERFRPRGLAVVGIALNSEGTTPARLVDLYVEDVGFRFPVLLAAPDDLELIGGLGPTRSVPRTVLLDGAGRMVLDQVGETRFQAVESRVLGLLGQR
jgi:thiol-disulfide isomerase/thioredoxin